MLHVVQTRNVLVCFLAPLALVCLHCGHSERPSSQQAEHTILESISIGRGPSDGSSPEDAITETADTSSAGGADSEDDDISETGDIIEGLPAGRQYKMHSYTEAPHDYNPEYHPNPSVEGLGLKGQKGPWHDIKTDHWDYLKKSREMLANQMQWFSKDGYMRYKSDMPYINLAKMEEEQKAWPIEQAKTMESVQKVQEEATRTMAKMRAAHEEMMEKDPSPEIKQQYDRLQSDESEAALAGSSSA
mmetsp:Transcript_45107/g.81414  ORF Transcript_45107/g.81414 Transcript_45107/m.81414 type:complete len:245 (-) Transcript_45107:24-758(-)